MSDRKPLVIADDRSGTSGQAVVQQLQAGDDLDIPLADRVMRLETIVRDLVEHLVAIGHPMPTNLMSVLEVPS